MQNSTEVTYSVKNLDDTTSVEDFYNHFMALLSDPTKLRLTIDFSLLTFVPPQAVLAILCATRLWKLHKHEIVTLIVKPEVQRYLERLDFFKVGADFLTPQFSLTGEFRRSDENKTLVEIMNISSTPEQNALDLYHISGRVRKILGSWLADRTTTTCTLLNEIVENVIHSNDIAFATVQRYQKKKGSGSNIHIGVADLGIGVEASLRPKFPDIGKGSDYLLHSLKLSVSSRLENGGIGLYRVYGIVKDGQGTLLIRSQGSMLQFYGGENYDYWDNLPIIPGTQVFIKLWGGHPEWQELLSNP